MLTNDLGIPKLDMQKVAAHRHKKKQKRPKAKKESSIKSSKSGFEID